MKFYVATKAENWPRAREVMDLIRMTGHEVTYDWTADVEAWGPMGSAQEREPKSDLELAEFARLDIEGVRQCQVNLHLPYPGLGGTFVEMGAALALGKLVWVLGPVVQWHPFYKLPSVWHFKVSDQPDAQAQREAEDGALYVALKAARYQERLPNHEATSFAPERFFTFTELTLAT